MHLVHNERTKLIASWLNTLATALIAAGFFAPAAALVYGLSHPAIGAGYMLALAVGCLGPGGRLTYARQNDAREIDRMTSQEVEILKIYVLLSPFLIFGLAVGVVWLTGWMDRREQRQHPAE
jgi:hypothetical protein